MYPKILTFFLLIFLWLTFISCQKNGDSGGSGSGNGGGSGNTLSDSIFVLLSFNNDQYGGGRHFLYDTSGKLKLSSVYHTAVNFDSTFFRYNSNKTIKSVVDKQAANEYYPCVFVYDAQNRVSKIIHKRKSNQWNEIYFDTYNNPSDFSEYDSLNYDNQNRMISAYVIEYNIFPVGQYVSQKVLLQYSGQNDSLLSQVQSFNYNQSGVQVSSDMIKFNSYDTLNNPFYRDLRYNHFFLRGTYYSFLPMLVSSYLTSFLTFSPHNCTNVTVINTWGTSNYNGPVPFFYNSDKLPVYITTNQLHYFRYTYQKIKK